MSLITTSTHPCALQLDSLQLIQQKPDVIFVYWQLSEVKKNLIAAHFGRPWQELSPALRFYAENVPPAISHRALELPLPDGNSCFVSGFHGGEAVSADLGIYNEQGQFLALLHANSIQLPRHHAVTEAQPPATPAQAAVLYQPQPIQPFPDKQEACGHFSAYSIYYPKKNS